MYDIRWHGGRGGSAKSDFISDGSLIKHLMRGGGGVKKYLKSSDIIYGRSLTKGFFLALMDSKFAPKHPMTLKSMRTF